MEAVLSKREDRITLYAVLKVTITHISQNNKIFIRYTDADGRIILRWIFRKWEGVVRTGWSWLRIGTVGGHLRLR